MAKKTSTPDLIDRNELAAILRTTPKAISEARRAGLLPPALRLPVKGFYRWERKDIDAWLRKIKRSAHKVISAVLEHDVGTEDEEGSK